MKKIFIFAIGLLSAGVANAQTEASTTGEGVKFGIKAGANLSNMIKTGDDDFNTEFKPGLHAGFFVDIPIVDRLSFAPEVVYSQKGYKRTGTSLLFGDTEYSVTTNFIELPILAKINAAPGFNIFLGPQVSFLASSKTKFETENASFEQTIDEENDDLRKSLVGGVIGAGFDITPQLGINARYALDLQKNDNGNSETPEYKNQVIQVGLGYKF